MSLSNKAKTALISTGLAGIMLVSSTKLPEKAVNYINRAADEVVAYTQNIDNKTKYEIIEHRISHGDRIRKLVGGNPGLEDITYAINPGIDAGKLSIGTIIKLPQKSDSPYAKTLPELLKEYRTSSR